MKLLIFLLFFSFCLISNIFGEDKSDQYEVKDWRDVFPMPSDDSYYREQDATFLKLREMSKPIDSMLPETRQAIPESYRVPLYPVRHQLRCNACWAFAAVCTLETALQLQLNIAQQLSEQHLVNCVNEDFICTDYSNAIKALQYVKNEYALAANIQPYIGKKRHCVKIWRLDVMLNYIYTIHALDLLPNSIQIKNWIKTKGAAVVTIAPPALEGYDRYANKSFSPTNTSAAYSHSMNLVGWDTSDPDDPYWIMRDSYKDDFFKNGYLHVNMNHAHKLVRNIAVFVDNMEEEENEPTTTPTPNTETTVRTTEESTRGLTTETMIPTTEESTTELTTIEDVFWDPNFPISRGHYTTSGYISSSSSTDPSTSSPTTSEYTTTPEEITTTEACSYESYEYIEIKVSARGWPNRQTVHLQRNAYHIIIRIVVLPCVAKPPTLPQDENADMVKVYISGLDGPQDFILEQGSNILLKLIPLSLSVRQEKVCEIDEPENQI